MKKFNLIYKLYFLNKQVLKDLKKKFQLKQNALQPIVLPFVLLSFKEEIKWWSKDSVCLYDVHINGLDNFVCYKCYFEIILYSILNQ